MKINYSNNNFAYRLNLIYYRSCVGIYKSHAEYCESNIGNRQMMNDFNFNVKL